MRRRQFITLLGGAASWPLAALAQERERIRRIGVLMASAENNPQYQTCMAGFRHAFQKLGWAEGRNIQIDYRWAAFDAKLMDQFSKELLALQPDVILLVASVPCFDYSQDIESIRAAMYDGGIIVLDSSDSEGYDYDTIEMGADGYIHKDFESQEIVHVINHVSRGEVIISPEGAA